MALENVPRCQHIKINGTQCGCPALRRRRLCFFHRRVLEQRARIVRDQFAQRPFEVPVLEDANAIQMALMQVMQMLAYRRIEHKTAGLLLYALQTASVNLRNTKFEPESTDVVIDRDTVHLTSINGPQWFEEDFDEEEDEEESEENDNEEENEDEDEDEQSEVDDDGEETQEDSDKAEDGKKVASSAKSKQPATSQPPTAMPGKMPMMKAGESPLETLKRILAAPEKRLGPG